MSYVNPFYHDFPSFKITPRHNAAGRNDKHQKYLRELYIIFYGCIMYIYNIPPIHTTHKISEQ